MLKNKPLILIGQDAKAMNWMQRLLGSGYMKPLTAQMRKEI